MAAKSSRSLTAIVVLRPADSPGDCLVQPLDQSKFSCSKLPRTMSIWFWVSPRTDTPWYLSVPVRYHHHAWKDFFFCWSGVSCISVCSRCLLSCQWEPQRGASLSIIFSAYLVFIDKDEISLSFLSSSLSPISLSSYDRCFKPFTIFMTICWTLSSGCLSLS